MGSASEVPDTGGTLAGADLGIAGALQPAQGQGKKPKFRNLRPSLGMKPLTDAAKALLAVRNALIQGESDLAQAEFLASKRRTLDGVLKGRLAKALIDDPNVLAAISTEKA